MIKRKVLIAAPIHPVLGDGLEESGYELIYAEKITQENAFDLIKGCTGVITSTRLQLDRALIDAAGSLEWIGRMGSGMEVIDLDYAKKKGIATYGSPEGNCNAVAEHALGMLLALTKKICSSYEEVKQGKWIRDANRGMELEGKTIGIIGFGHTGRSFAKKLKGFDVKILAYDKYNQKCFPEEVGCCDSLEPLFENADIISFHVPLKEDTFHYFNNDFLGKMKKPFLLINTSRGKVADIHALYKGLKEKKITGVCLDVLEEEPLEKLKDGERRLLDEIMKDPAVIITPHIAGYSHESLFKMSHALLRKIVMRK